MSQENHDPKPTFEKTLEWWKDKERLMENASIIPRSEYDPKKHIKVEFTDDSFFELSYSKTTINHRYIPDPRDSVVVFEKTLLEILTNEIPNADYFKLLRALSEDRKGSKRDPETNNNNLDQEEDHHPSTKKVSLSNLFKKRSSDKKPDNIEKDEKNQNNSQEQPPVKRRKPSFGRLVNTIFNSKNKKNKDKDDDAPLNHNDFNNG